MGGEVGWLLSMAAGGWSCVAIAGGVWWYFDREVASGWLAANCDNVRISASL